MATYDRWTFVVPDSLHEALSADLWARGTMGIEDAKAEPGRARLVAYFAPDGLDAEAAEAWRVRGASVQKETLPDQDWLANYRASATPVDIGRGFRIDPRDPDDAPDPDAERRVAEAGRHLLRIPARQAFGTGSHATTRLALTLLETLDVVERDVLDVGTGSGILAFAATLLGARCVVGFDLDPIAVVIAGQNAALNPAVPQRPAVFAGRLDALRPGPAFDIAVVNVLPERIRDDLPRLRSLLRPSARVISSGNLITETGSVLATWAHQGLVPVEERHDEEWAAFVLAPGSAS